MTGRAPRPLLLTIWCVDLVCICMCTQFDVAEELTADGSFTLETERRLDPSAHRVRCLSHDDYDVVAEGEEEGCHAVLRELATREHTLQVFTRTSTEE